MIHLRTIAWLIPLVSVPCCAAALTITSPGYYELGDDITFSPGGADSIISIQTSNVTLDLGGRIIQQGNATAGVDGIALTPGLSNVIIRNGTIRNVTNRGIFIDSNGASSSQIVISDIVFDTCQSRGISFEDAGGSNFANDCVIKNCRLINCTSSGVSGDFVINCERCNRFVIKDIFMSGQGTAAPFTGLARAAIRLNLVLTSFIENVVIASFATNNTPFTSISIETNSQVLVLKNILMADTNALSAAYKGISITGSTVPQSAFIGIVGTSNTGGTTASHITSNGTAITNCLFLDCIAGGMTATTSAVTVFDIGSGSNGNIFINCIAKNGTAAASVFVGFNIVNNTTTSLIDCIVQECISAGVSNNCFPFLLSSASTRCSMIRCYALSNSATGSGTVVGIFLTSATSSSINDCISAGQAGTGGGSSAEGINFSSCNACTADNCAAYRNVGVVNSRGFNLSADTGSSFLRNVSLINGTVAGNQFLGFAGTQNQVTGVATPNSTFSPYTNVGLV